MYTVECSLCVNRRHVLNCISYGGKVVAVVVVAAMERKHSW